MVEKVLYLHFHADPLKHIMCMPQSSVYLAAYAYHCRLVQLFIADYNRHIYSASIKLHVVLSIIISATVIHRINFNRLMPICVYEISSLVNGMQCNRHIPGLLSTLADV